MPAHRSLGAGVRTCGQSTGQERSASLGPSTSPERWAERGEKETQCSSQGTLGTKTLL